MGLATSAAKLLTSAGVAPGAVAGGLAALGGAGLIGAAGKTASAANLANQWSLKGQSNAMAFNAAQSAQANALNTAYLESQQAYNDYQAALANATQLNTWNRTAEYNSAEAQKNREWQEYMSSTAYQRAVTDLKAAGLNPILAAMNGGASMGTGSTATQGNISAAMASSGLQNGAMNSIGGFQGIMENTSGALAIAGAISEGMQKIWDALHLTDDHGNNPVVGSILNATGVYKAWDNLKEKYQDYKKENPGANLKENTTKSYKSINELMRRISAGGASFPNIK